MPRVDTYGLIAASRGLSEIIRRRRDSCPSHVHERGFFFEFESLEDEIVTRCISHAGTQQPITLLLTLISRGFIYDREKDLTQKILKDMTYIGAMGPPGGGRNNVDPRFVALFSVFNLPDPTSDVLKHMYSSIINERLRDFSPSVKDAAAKFPDAMLELFSYILESQYPRLAISAPRPSERPERGHDLLHMDETVSRELKPNLKFGPRRPPADAGEVPLHFQSERSFEGHGRRLSGDAGGLRAVGAARAIV